MTIRRMITALALCLLLPGALACAQGEPMERGEPLGLSSPAAILMEQKTGRVIFEKNADERRPVASVTKVMTILLTLEAIDSGKIGVQDTVSVSQSAASMGGSQAFLDAGGRYPVGDLLARGVCPRDERARAGAGAFKHELRQLHRPARAGAFYVRAGCGAPQPGARPPSAVL